MAKFGVKDFEAPAWMRDDEASAEEFGVLPENVEAVNIFVACATQWTYGASGRPLGIRYEALEALFCMSGIDPKDNLWRVRLMENAALKEFASMTKD